MTSSSPNLARITSLAAWTKFFHPTTGIFRFPSEAGATIDHLDIDLRFVEHSPEMLDIQGSAQIYLPGVSKVTLRGGEYVQDSEERMECLSEVLCALNPIELRWLNAFDDPAEQQTLSTVLVHPAIITAGELWQSKGSLRKLVIQGGFPVPNLTAPTPFSVTPAVTPSASPGPNQRSFSGAAGFPHTGLPSLSLTKPKPLDEAKAKERAERKRLAEYSLKPRWEFAFGTWGVTEIRWNFDGRFTPAGIKTILSRLFEALDDTFPSTSHKVHRDLPSLITFSPVPIDILPDVQALPNDLHLHGLAEYLADSAFVSTDSERFARLFDLTQKEPEEKYRNTKRLRAEMMLLNQVGASDGVEIVHPDQLKCPAPADRNHSGLSVPNADIIGASPAQSAGGLSLGETEGSDEDDVAQTPPMGSSIHMPQNGAAAGVGLGMDLGMPKKAAGQQGQQIRRMSEEAF